MKRRIVWSMVAIVALIVLGAIAFLNVFEQVPTTRHEPAKMEAWLNPFLALERTVTRLGRPVIHLQRSLAAKDLPERSTLILDRNHQHQIASAQTDELLAWVKRGGYLIVAPLPLDDPLLTRLGTKRATGKGLGCSGDDDTASDDSDDEDDDAPEHMPPAAKPVPKPGEKPAQPKLIDYQLPDDDVVFHLRCYYGGLESSDLARENGLVDATRAVHQYRWGQGHITVFDELYRFNNWSLGSDDHAELIWALLKKYQPQGEIRVASRLEVPSLWRFLGESAWMALISLALLIAVWLWRIIPRFGGIKPESGETRRGLIEHLHAIGRSVWREGGTHHWLSVVRQHFRQRLILRHPYIARLDNPAQQEALARLAGCSTKSILKALTPGLAKTPDEFTEAIRTLRRLDETL